MTIFQKRLQAWTLSVLGNAAYKPYRQWPLEKSVGKRGNCFVLHESIYESLYHTSKTCTEVYPGAWSCWVACQHVKKVEAHLVLLLLKIVVVMCEL